MKGMSAAASSVLFNPSHYSTPFVWDYDDSDNAPYGRHDNAPSSGRLRSPSSLSMNLARASQESNKRLKLSEGGERIDKYMVQSTCAIEWSTVAALFENVKAVEKPSRDHDDHNIAVPLGSTIFAPFYRKIEDEADLPSDDESDAEENLDDDHILAEHQKVLNTIREKFDTMMRIRQEYQDRSRRATFGRPPAV